MPEILSILKKRSNEDWLIDYDSQQLYQLTAELLLQIKQPVKIILAETHPLNFLAGFLAGVAADCQVFLCNPHWGESEWQQVFDLVQPDLIWGSPPSLNKGGVRGEGILPISTGVRGESEAYFPCIMIPTGGTSGKIRFAIHTWHTLTASVRGFSSYFSQISINSFCILPLYHVSGLMQFLRSFLTGGKIQILSYKSIKDEIPVNINYQDFFISLVPTQLQYLLENKANWLASFQTILLGGAPPWSSLIENARKHHLKLAPCYGMTETASQVVTLKPEDFLRGNHTNGQTLPHAQIIICDDEGNFLETNQIGIISIKSDSLYLGYYPELITHNYFLTDDLGFLDSQGNLTIIGRNSQKIITGGENVFPSEVEAAILATKLVQDVCVIGLPDNYWGQVVTAVYVPKELDLLTVTIKTAIKDKLAAYKCPKRWLVVESLPRNEQGKVNLEIVRQWAHQ